MQGEPDHAMSTTVGSQVHAAGPECHPERHAGYGVSFCATDMKLQAVSLSHISMLDPCTYLVDDYVRLYSSVCSERAQLISQIGHQECL